MITTVVYGAVGACGYLMFGDDVTDEVRFFFAPVRVLVIIMAEAF